MKGYFSIGLLFLLFSLNSAISQTYDWSKQWGYIPSGSVSQVYAYDVAVDALGNSYTLSFGNQAVDFDPSNNQLTGTTQCGAVTKLDPTGNVIWIKFIPRTAGFGTQIFPKRIIIKGNDLYIAGEIFSGTFDFNTSPTVTNNLSGPSAFITKWNLDGDFIFADSFGSSGITVTDMEISDNDEIYISGVFTNAFSFASTAVTTGGSNSVYLVKYNSNATQAFVRFYGGTSGVSTQVGATTLSDGSVFLTGGFSGSVDFDPTAGIDTHTSQLGNNDIFLQKMDQFGSVVWTYTGGGSNGDFGADLTSDDSDNIYLTGLTQSATIDLNFGSGNSNTTANNQDAFIAKYDMNGNFIWGNTILSAGGSSNATRPYEITHYNGSIYCVGLLAGTADFNFGNGVFNLSAVGTGNSFLLKMNTYGTFNWAGCLTGPINYNNNANGVSAANGVIFVAGEFRGLTDFNPGTGTDIQNSTTTSNGTPDYSAYVLKLIDCNPSFDTISTTSCDTYTAPDGAVYNSSGLYSATITNAAGCDSVITINLTITNSSSSNITEVVCGNYLAPDGQSYNTSGTYTAIIPNAVGCDSVIQINLTVNPLPNVSAGNDTTICYGSQITLSGSGADNYVWNNGIVDGIVFQPNSSNTYTVIGYDSNNCSDTAAVTVIVLQDASAGIDMNITSACNPVTVTFINLNPNSQSCTWNLGNGVTSNSDTVNTVYTQAGSYDVIFAIVDSNGCSYQYTYGGIVNVFPEPVSNFTTPANLISFNQPVSFTNTSTNATSFEWVFGDNSPLNFDVNPTHTYQNSNVDSVIVQLIAMAQNGCVDTSYQVLYFNSNSTTGVVIPTGFSPNNDVENDVWIVYGLENYPNASILVFNRWGQEVYTGDSQNNSWDGYYLDQLLPVGDYYYIVDLGDGQKFNGIVTLKY